MARQLFYADEGLLCPREDQGEAGRGNAEDGLTTSHSEAGPAGGGLLAQNIVHFARALREAGIPLGPGGVLDALAAIESAGIGDRDDFYTTLHAVFVKKHEESLLFDQAFRIFWKRKGLIEKLIAMLSSRAPGQRG